ncbi:hypothetical protein D3C87_163650 [compost metagenome]
MKSILFSMVALSFFSIPVFAQDTCADKRADIEMQIVEAQSAKNKNREAGLRKALSELNAHCTDEGLSKAHQEKLNKLQAKVDERMADLKAAEAKGDKKKIEKQTKKLQEAETELQNAK